MGKIWTPGGGSGSAGSEDCTAGKDKVLSGYTAITKDSGEEPAEGTMANQGAVSQALNAGGSYAIPEGYHNGSGKVTANSLSSQTGGATAGDGDVLSGKTYWKDGAKRTGTMANQGAKTSALNAGGSYTIPAGYHNGSGKVTANSLSSQTSATATAAQILSGQTAWVNGSKVTGSMANQGTKTSALNCGGNYTIPAGYHSGSGKVTANSLASQTSATAAAGNLISGKTAWVNGAKITGTLSIQSAISFSAAALSYDKIRISWKNPAKGPWQGVFIQMSTSGNPGTGGGSRVYTGAGTNPKQANGNNYVDIDGLSPNTQYYFTCTSYCDGIGWGTSYNVNYRTQSVTTQQLCQVPYGGSGGLGGGRMLFLRCDPNNAGFLYMSYMKWNGQPTIGNTYLPWSSENTIYGYVEDYENMYDGKQGLNTPISLWLRVNENTGDPSAIAMCQTMINMLRQFTQVHVDSTGYSGNHDYTDHWDWNITELYYDTITSSTEKYKVKSAGYYVVIKFNVTLANIVYMKKFRLTFR